jgi:hypothetical protein
MIEVKIGNKTVKVDTHLTIEKYQQIQRNPKKFEDESEILGLYLGITKKELRNLPVDQIKFVEGLLTQHLMKPKTDEIVFTFNYNGIAYGLENDWGNMTWGQWTDLEVFSQKDKINDNIHIIMALLYRPIKIQDGVKYELEPFNSDEVMKRAGQFKGLPIYYWYGVTTFFLQISSLYMIDIETSMRARMMIEKYLSPLRKILPSWLLPKVPQDFTLRQVSDL